MIYFGVLPLQLAESQRNAAHDIRNALFEVIALVEMPEMAGHGWKEGGETALVEMPEMAGNRHASSNPLFAQEKEGGGKEKGEAKGEVTEAGKRAVETKIEHPITASRDANKLAVHVRNVTSRIMHRLDASIRDGRSVVHQNATRLNPQINACNLRLIMEEDLTLDDLVVLTVAKDFPQSVETDVPWIRTIVQNLVHNAKKHGPPGGKIQVHMNCANGEASIEVTDQGLGIDPARAREVFDPQASQQSNGIGLQAVRTYCMGLGGTCGAFKSTVRWWSGGCWVLSFVFGMRCVLSLLVFLIVFIIFFFFFSCLVTVLGEISYRSNQWVDTEYVWVSGFAC